VRTVFLDGDDDEIAPDVSPDGQWIAYVSDVSGDDQVYVTTFPVAGARSRVSPSGGHSPAWSPDGKTLYYLQGSKMMALSIETDGGLRVVGREELFEGEFMQYRWSRQYDITPDGSRFVMIKNPTKGDVEVVTNWFEELKALLP
jgi:Tol biopolymer transport system component